MSDTQGKSKMKNKYAVEEELTQEYNRLMEYFDERILQNKTSIQKLKKIYKNHKKLSNYKNKKNKSSNKSETATIGETATLQTNV